VLKKEVNEGKENVLHFENPACGSNGDVVVVFSPSFCGASFLLTTTLTDPTWKKHPAYCRRRVQPEFRRP